MSPTRTCPICERHAPIQIETGIAYCAVCDIDIAPDRGPDLEAYTRVSTPEDAVRYLVEYYKIPECMINHLLFRCRTFAETRKKESS